jgi:hypothetical protein
LYAKQYNTNTNTANISYALDSANFGQPFSSGSYNLGITRSTSGPREQDSSTYRAADMSSILNPGNPWARSNEGAVNVAVAPVLWPLIGAALTVDGLMGAADGQPGGGAGKAVSKVINGNSRLSTKAQHGYEIIDTHTGQAVKTGVSGGAQTTTGGSVRANSQANRWNREVGQPCRYVGCIKMEIPAGPGARESILKWEAENAARLRDAGQLRDPTKHTRP